MFPLLLATKTFIKYTFLYYPMVEEDIPFTEVDVVPEDGAIPLVTARAVQVQKARKVRGTAAPPVLARMKQLSTLLPAEDPRLYAAADFVAGAYGGPGITETDFYILMHSALLRRAYPIRSRLEKYFPSLTGRLMPSKLPEHLGDLIVAAAKIIAPDKQSFQKRIGALRERARESPPPTMYAIFKPNGSYTAFA